MKIFRLTDFKISFGIALFFAVLILLVTGADEYSFFDLISPKAASFLRGLEYRAFDQMFVYRGRVGSPKDVAIAAIDEKSVNAIGRWPWPRTRTADLIRELNKKGAAAIALDLVFSEPDTLGTYGMLNEVLEHLKRVPKSEVDWKALNKEIATLGARLPNDLRRSLPLLEKREVELKKFENFLRAERERENADRIMGETIHDADNVVMGYFFLKRPETVGLKDAEYLDYSTLEHSKITAFGGRYTQVERAKESLGSLRWGFKGVKTNIPAIVGDNGVQGFFNADADSDGIYRSAPLLVYINGEVYPSLNLQAVQTYYRKTSGEALGNIIPFFSSDEGGLDHIRSNVPYKINTNSKGMVLYNWYGPEATVDSFSVIDILEGRITRSQIAGKIIFVGPTARGIADFRTVPFGDNFPGVEMHATLAGNILENNYLLRDLSVLLGEALFVLVFGTLYGWLVVGKVLATSKRATGIILAFLFMIAFGTFLIWIDYTVIFLQLHIWVRPVFPLVAFFTIYLAVTLRGYMREEVMKRQIKQTFDIYVSPLVVDQMLQDPDKFRLGGERKELTVFFSDIRNFTSLSEQVQPEELVQFLNNYFTPMTDIILQHDGTLDKFIGDAIMAFWGAPLASEVHPIKACHCALDMVAELEKLRVEWEKKKFPPMHTGIGINTGPMIVGNMGSKKRFSYTVIGDEVNLSSRLEGLCKEYGSSIILGSKTAWRVREDFILRPLDRVRVKGKMTPEEIYELMGRRKAKNEAEESRSQSLIQVAESYAEALELFWAREWEKAANGFRRVLNILPEDKPTKMFLEQIAAFIDDEPNTNWDGIRVMTKK